jgi:hypothetical protein
VGAKEPALAHRRTGIVMMVLLSVSALWLLGMLAAAAHAQDAGRTGANGWRIAIAFVAVVPLAIWLTPQPNWIAVLLALGAFWRLIAGPMARVGGFLAGASAALVAALQIAGGVAFWLAVPVTALGLVLVFAWSCNNRFRRWEWVLVAVAIVIPPVGLANDIIYGWQSATVLNQAAVKTGAVAPPAWAIAIVGAALLAGLMRGIWIRR